MLPYLHLGPLSLPIYGLCMLVGTVLGLALAIRWAGQRGVDRELIVELAIVGLVAGIAGARFVFIIEQWDTMFADRPPARLSAGPREPLVAGDELVLRTHAGEARVRFEGGEDTARAAQRIEEQAGARDIEAQVRTRSHRGEAGVVEFVRGFSLRTRTRGPEAWLDVIDGPAARKLSLQPGKNYGDARPLVRVLDLREGGLTYFGAALGVIAGWLFWLRRKKADTLAVLDVAAPVLPLGLFFGRLGCLARSCCWGREAGDHALLAVSFPPWSLPWLQMAEERLPLTHDPDLARRTMTPAMEAILAPTGLLQGTPPLHATQLYEGVGVLIIAALLVLYRARWQRTLGQCFVLTIILQAPLRFVVEHLRRDHDVFAPKVLGYSLTETQVVAALMLAVAVPLFVWLGRRGRPVPAAAGAPAPAVDPPRPPQGAP